jgi:Xaa-Pro aminopeptidase
MNLSRFNNFLNSPAKKILPFSEYIFKFRRTSLSLEDLRKFRKTQDLAIGAAEEISKLVRPGMTEIEAANLLDTYLRDHGVNAFVHYSFAWFGHRTRFNHCRNYKDLMPTRRVLEEGDVFILDTAPVLNGTPADIGLSFCLGDNSEFSSAMLLLEKIKKKIPGLFELNCASGQKIYQWINQIIDQQGYDSIHQLYPFGVLAHRLYEVPFEKLPGVFKPFTWQAYWSLLSRGFYSETISGNTNINLDGIWAIEPHLGGTDFGVKFEEMIYVQNGQAQWLSSMSDIKD